MHWQRETNPHFGISQNEDQDSQLPSSGVVTQPRRPDQQNQRPEQHPRSTQPQPHPKQQNSETSLSPWFPPPTLQSHGHDPHDRVSSSQAPRAKKPKRSDEPKQPLGPWKKLPDSQDHHVRQSEPQGEHSGPQRSGPQGSPVTQSKHQDQHPQPESGEPVQPQPQENRRRSRGPQVPSPRPTKLITWFLAWFCAIFWVVVILGGLIVLIVYLLFRPHNPRFDVSSATLNAAYLDVGVLLNADLTVLANFTNPNKKVKVDFSYIVLDLYYGKTLIASQYVEPFSAARASSWLTTVHMITSQVRLPLAETDRLNKEINNNAVVFHVKGVFRARSNLGTFLRYSYGLYSHCTIVMTGPPSGIVRASKCKTKR